MTPLRHVGVVTGLADFVNFLAALHSRTGQTDIASMAVSVALYGTDLTLPPKLVEEFRAIVQAAFPTIEIERVPSQRLQGARFDSENYDAFNAQEERIVYGHSIHKEIYLSFYSFLKPKEFIFFDNGLSSYASHNVDIAKDFVKFNLPIPSFANMTLCPDLPAPPYLKDFPVRPVTFSDYSAGFENIRAASPQRPSEQWLPNHVLIGTSLFRTGKISWEAERALYMRVIESLHARGEYNILFKAHPRASSRPLITEEDGIEVIDCSAPLEIFAIPNHPGVAYSISSTSLITLKKFYGWRTYRLENEATRTLLSQSPHLSKVSGISVYRV